MGTTHSALSRSHKPIICNCRLLFPQLTFSLRFFVMPLNDYALYGKAANGFWLVILGRLLK